METEGLRDVTKTKASHHRPTNKAPVAEKETWPSTPGGARLADEVKASGLPDHVKERLVREIIQYEGSHGKCTETFTKKLRRQLR
jgi:hypothetical protein